MKTNFIPGNVSTIGEWSSGKTFALKHFIKCNIYLPQGTYCGGIVFVPIDDKKSNEFYAKSSDYTFEGKTILTKSFFKAFKKEDKQIIDLSYIE